ncbi:MAG: SH3 domain-containing protein [Rhizobiaceae bacterium]
MKSVIFVLSLLISTLSFSLSADAAWRGYASGDVNMRSGPGSRHSVRLVVPGGARVWVHSCRRFWCKITWRNRTGWVSRRYLVEELDRYHDDYYDDDDRYYDTPIYIPRSYHRSRTHLRKYRKRKKFARKQARKFRKKIRPKYRKRYRKRSQRRKYRRPKNYRVRAARSMRGLAKRYRNRSRARNRGTRRCRLPMCRN